MSHYLELIEWDDKLPLSWSESRIQKTLERAYCPTPEMIEFHRTLDISVTRWAKIGHREAGRGCGFRGEDVWLLAVKGGLSFERKDHAMLFKLTFGGAA